jgi:5-methylcytosine-specific restriction endonuclease McrA
MIYKVLVLLFIGLIMLALKRMPLEIKRIYSRDYYRDTYLKSDAWKRKRYLVLKRDNWRCVYCGGLATQVHHKKYAKKNIGQEPIKWLLSVCKNCHENIHQ